MKTCYVVALQTLTAVAVAQDLSGVDLDKGMTREQQGHIIAANGLAPEMQELKPRFQDYAGPTVKRTKVRYGKYRLPKASATTISSLLTGEKGTMSTIAIGMKKPCAEYCNLVTAMASLEYANGTEATMENGSWLHHIVVLATGTGRQDTVCPMPGERFFSSGNEKTPTAFGDVTQKKVKSCFPLGPRDSFQAELELMNMDDVEKDVWITIDFEYIPGKKPADWKVAKAAWLDVTNCGISYVRPPTKQTFTLSSKGWTSQYNGVMLGVGGHLHDGGINLQIFNNKNVICDSKATYTKPGEVGGGLMAKAGGGVAPGGHGGMSHSRRDGPHGGDGVHIKQMSTCSMIGDIKKGDTIHIEANYDYTKFPGLKSTEIMGIAILYSAMDMPSPAEAVAAPKAAAAPKSATAPRTAPKGLKAFPKGSRR